MRRTLLHLGSLACLSALASPLLFAAACGKPQVEPRLAPGRRLASITVTSPSFTDGARIPVDHTCDGKDAIPELVISSPPDGTKSLLLLVEDPDVPSGMFTHLIAFNISPDLRKLPSAPDLAAAGEAARFGLNDFQTTHYSGPCPPKGEAHRYRFHVIALDTMLKLEEGANRAQVDEAIDNHIIGEGVLSGHFGH